MAEVQTELGNWIDTGTIAKHILGELEDQGIEPSPENGQKVWLDFLLTELCEGIRNSVNALVDKGDLKIPR